MLLFDIGIFFSILDKRYSQWLSYVVVFSSSEPCVIFRTQYVDSTYVYFLFFYVFPFFLIFFFFYDRFYYIDYLVH